MRRRLFSVRHARGLWALYRGFEALLARFLGKPGGTTTRLVTGVEARVKGALFDCRMCGACILSSTGLSCPMNCPKALRNGPCGGVRQDGGCEVYPEMPCVWVKAWEGAQKLPGGMAAIGAVQPPLDHRKKGQSSWLAAAAKSAAAKSTDVAAS